MFTSRWWLSMALALCAVVAGTSHPAAALDESEWQAAVSAGYLRLWVDGQGLNAGVATLAGRYGLSDDISVRLSAGGAWHPKGGGVPAVRVGMLGAGATYSWNVLRVIPFLDAGVGLVVTGGDGTRAEQALGADASLGAEYFLDRRWTLGAAARFEAYPVKLGGVGVQGHPSALSLSLRLARTF